MTLHFHSHSFTEPSDFSRSEFRRSLSEIFGATRPAPGNASVSLYAKLSVEHIKRLLSLFFFHLQLAR